MMSSFCSLVPGDTNMRYPSDSSICEQVVELDSTTDVLLLRLKSKKLYFFFKTENKWKQSGFGFSFQTPYFSNIEFINSMTNNCIFLILENF